MKRSNIKYFVLLPLVIAVTVALWCVPPTFFGSLGDALTATQQRTIAIFAFAALLIPIMVAMGRGLLASPNAAAFTAFGGQQALSVFVALCASLAICLPISTPPNALASSTGLVQTRDMARIGLLLGVIGLVLGFFWVTKVVPF